MPNAQNLKRMFIVRNPTQNRSLKLFSQNTQVHMLLHWIKITHSVTAVYKYSEYLIFFVHDANYYYLYIG